MQLAFKLLLVGDVFGNADDYHPVTFLLLVDVALVTEPAYLAVCIENAVLAVFNRAFDQHLGQAALGVFQVIGVDAVAPFVEVRQHQARGAAEDAFVGGADVEHLACFPVERPEHRVDAVEQRAVELFTFAQASHFALGMQQGQQYLGCLGS
ncbi:hypothetical protein D3C73_1120420 [compost metagenome]